MEKDKINKDFKSCNLPVQFVANNPGRRWNGNSPTSFWADVVTTKKKGEVFSVFIGKDCEITILDKAPSSKHLLVLAKTEERKERFLFGHDERHLFIAPLDGVVSTVNQAFDDLQPDIVKTAAQKGLKVVRQGEWFFIPDDNFVPFSECPVQHKTRIARDSFGNPHVADELVRIGAVSTYVRGKVRHKEHSTLNFKVWHRVERNLEAESSSVNYVD